MVNEQTSRPRFPMYHVVNGSGHASPFDALAREEGCLDRVTPRNSVTYEIFVGRILHYKIFVVNCRVLGSLSVARQPKSRI